MVIPVRSAVCFPSVLILTQTLKPLSPYIVLQFASRIPARYVTDTTFSRVKLIEAENFLSAEYLAQISDDGYEAKYSLSYFPPSFVYEILRMPFVRSRSRR